MTLHDFLEATATIPAPVLRRALVTEHLDVATGGAVSDNGEADTEAMHHAA